MAPAKASRFPAKPASRGASSEKYEAQYSRTSAPIPEASSTMSSASASRRSSTKTSYAGIHRHDQVTDPPDAAVFHCVAAHTVAAAGGSASTTNARPPRRRTSGAAHAARTKWQTMSAVIRPRWASRACPRRASGAWAKHHGHRALNRDISPTSYHPYGAPRRCGTPPRTRLYGDRHVPACAGFANWRVAVPRQPVARGTMWGPTGKDAEARLAPITDEP